MIPIVWILWNNFIKYFAISTFLKAKFCFAKLKVEKDTRAKIVLSQAYGNYCPKFPAHLCRSYYEYIQREYIQPLKKKWGIITVINRFGKLLFFHLKLGKIFSCYQPACYIFAEEVTELLTHCGGRASWLCGLCRPDGVWLAYIPGGNLPLPLCH